MKNTITFIKIKDAQPTGEYLPTSVDERKANADILITNCGSTYTVNSKIILSGKGVRKDYRNGSYEVTENKLNELRKTYFVACDF